MPQLPFLIVGSGPAALLAADFLSAAGHSVELFERRAGPGWKLLVAGSSGLNVTYNADDLSAYYLQRASEMAGCLAKFSQGAWLTHLAGLGEETFIGTSRRYFVKNHTAASLLHSWVDRLEDRGVKFHYGRELKSFSTGAVQFQDGSESRGRAILLALGGASWESSLPSWPSAFGEKDISFVPFAPANAGYSFRAPEGFFAAAEGKPIKGLCLTTARGTKQGELMITRYGLEGTPIYTLGCPGPALLDLKPDLAEEKLAARLQPFRGDKAQKLRGAKLSPGAELLFQALAPASVWENAPALAAGLKALAIELENPRPLSECISSRGGVSWDELTEGLELKKMPGVFCAGEMVDWDAPTGGFLIQGAVSMGFTAAAAMLRI